MHREILLKSSYLNSPKLVGCNLSHVCFLNDSRRASISGYRNSGSSRGTHSILWHLNVNTATAAVMNTSRTLPAAWLAPTFVTKERLGLHVMGGDENEIIVPVGSQSS